MCWCWLRSNTEHCTIFSVFFSVEVFHFGSFSLLISPSASISFASIFLEQCTYKFDSFFSYSDAMAMISCSSSEIKMVRRNHSLASYFSIKFGLARPSANKKGPADSTPTIFFFCFRNFLLLCVDVFFYLVFLAEGKWTVWRACTHKTDNAKDNVFFFCFRFRIANQWNT